jgi:hypothetical protein
MRKEHRQGSVSTLESLFRDLHVVVTLLHDDTSDVNLIQRYLCTIDLLWDTFTGETSLAFGRPRVFCRPISRREIKDAYGA